MKIATLNSVKKGMVKHVVFILMLVLFVLVVIDEIRYYYSGVINGYKYELNRIDNWHITKDDKVVVKPALLDMVVVKNYIVGLRLPAKHLECNGGYKIKLLFNKEYFILDTENNSTSIFKSEKIFHEKLSDLSIINDVSLDYSRFEYVIKKYTGRYNRIDYTNCVEMQIDLN